MVFCTPAKNRLQTMDALCRNSLKLSKENTLKWKFILGDNVPKLFGWFESEIELGYQDHSPRCYKHLLSLSIYDPFSESYCTKWDFHGVDKENWHFFPQTINEWKCACISLWAATENVYYSPSLLLLFHWIKTGGLDWKPIMLTFGSPELDDRPRLQ